MSLVSLLKERIPSFLPMSLINDVPIYFSPFAFRISTFKRLFKVLILFLFSSLGIFGCNCLEQGLRQQQSQAKDWVIGIPLKGCNACIWTRALSYSASSIGFSSASSSVCSS